jgi:hypothetical protein
MSKEAMISFPKKKMLEEDDFDMQIKSQEGTKIIKLSTFNEKDLGGEREERKVVGQEIEDYKESRSVAERAPTKKGLFGWKRKPSKDEDLRVNSTVKSQPLKPAQGQAVPQSMPPKQQKKSLPSEQQSSQIRPNESSQPAPVQKFNSAPLEVTSSTNTQTSLVPQGQEDQLCIVDPVLMKNTDFNAAFIHVGNLGKAKPKNTSKGVKFASTAETITLEISSDDEEMLDKPEFAPRGSSMKNVDNGRQSTKTEPAVTNRNEPLIQNNESGIRDNRQNFSRPGSVIDPEVLRENRQKNVTKQASRSELVFPLPPTVLGSARNTGPSPPQEQVEYQARKNSDPFGESLSRTSNNNLMPPVKVPDASRKKSPTPTPTTLNTSVQTDKDDRESLLNMISTLQAQVSHFQEESIRQQQVMEEQKNGFDKLSAQAYKKIKGLLTDRNIMTIELKSLRAQVTVCLMSRFKKWKCNMKNGRLMLGNDY